MCIRAYELRVLFLLVSIISGQAVLPGLSNENLYFAGLGGPLTAIYTTGLIFRPRYLIARMGLDSLVVFFYVIAIFRLVSITTM